MSIALSVVPCHGVRVCGRRTSDDGFDRRCLCRTAKKKKNTETVECDKLASSRLLWCTWLNKRTNAHTHIHMDWQYNAERSNFASECVGVKWRGC